MTLRNERRDSNERESRDLCEVQQQGARYAREYPPDAPMHTTLASVACLNLMSTLVEDRCIMTSSGHMNAATASSAAAAADPMPATLVFPVNTGTR